MKFSKTLALLTATFLTSTTLALAMNKQPQGQSSTVSEQEIKKKWSNASKIRSDGQDLVDGISIENLLRQYGQDRTIITVKMIQALWSNASKIRSDGQFLVDSRSIEYLLRQYYGQDPQIITNDMVLNLWRTCPDADPLWDIYQMIQGNPREGLTAQTLQGMIDQAPAGTRDYLRGHIFPNQHPMGGNINRYQGRAMDTHSQRLVLGDIKAMREYVQYAFTNLHTQHNLTYEQAQNRIRTSLQSLTNHDGNRIYSDTLIEALFKKIENEDQSGAVRNDIALGASYALALEESGLKGAFDLWAAGAFGDSLKAYDSQNEASRLSCVPGVHERSLGSGFQNLDLKITSEMATLQEEHTLQGTLNSPDYWQRVLGERGLTTLSSTQEIFKAMKEILQKRYEDSLRVLKGMKVKVQNKDNKEEEKPLDTSYLEKRFPKILEDLGKTSDSDLKKYVPYPPYMTTGRYETAWHHPINTRGETPAQGRGDIALDRFMEALYQLYYRNPYRPSLDFQGFHLDDVREIHHLAELRGVDTETTDILINDFIQRKNKSLEAMRKEKTKKEESKSSTPSTTPVQEPAQRLESLNPRALEASWRLKNVTKGSEDAKNLEAVDTLIERLRVENNLSQPQV